MDPLGKTEKTHSARSAIGSYCPLSLLCGNLPGRAAWPTGRRQGSCSPAGNGCTCSERHAPLRASARTVGNESGAPIGRAIGPGS